MPNKYGAVTVGGVDAISGMKPLSQRLRSLGPLARETMISILARWGVKIQSDAKHNITDNDNNDTGHTRAGIQVAYSADQLTVEVGSNDSTARWLEKGTQPHFPPLDAIIEWVRRRGIAGRDGRISAKENQFIVALAIARKIAAVGTRAHPFLGPAWEDNKNGFIDDVKTRVPSAFKGVTG